MEHKTVTITYRGKIYERIELDPNWQYLEVSAQMPTGDLDPWNYYWRRAVDLVALYDELCGRAGKVKPSADVAPMARKLLHYRPGKDVSGWGDTLRRLAAEFDSAYNKEGEGVDRWLWSGTLPREYEVHLWLDKAPIYRLNSRDRVVVTAPETDGTRHVYFDKYKGEQKKEDEGQ